MQFPLKLDFFSDDRYEMRDANNAEIIFVGHTKQLAPIPSEAKQLVEMANLGYQWKRIQNSINNQEYWAWQGDGEDHLESLTCPIVIQPEDLRKLLESKKNAPV